LQSTCSDFTLQSTRSDLLLNEIQQHRLKAEK
jgi:hypothetical protein